MYKIRPEIGRYEQGGVLSEPEVLRQLVASGSYLPVECTGVARPRVPLAFGTAVDDARRMLTEDRPPFQYAVDIVSLHDAGHESYPLPDQPRAAAPPWQQGWRDIEESGHVPRRDRAIKTWTAH